MNEDIHVWPTLRYRDAVAAIEFLESAFGFEPRAVHMSDADPSVVEHAELDWPLGGAIMLGTSRESTDWPASPGTGATYVVTDQPDDLFKRATDAGAEVVRALGDEDYGSRDFVVRDPEGNLWSFGTYAGE
jgi:uncharacterized glyoxalase superfamily protein PhnB